MAAVVPQGNGAVAEHAGAAAGADSTEPPPAAASEPPPVDAGSSTPPPADVAEVPAPVATPVPPDLLHDTRLSLSDTASEALATAGPSSRASQILSSLVERHTIGVSAMSPDGSFTITMVDGASVEFREHRGARPRRAALGPRSGDSPDGHRAHPGR